ncbi:anaerobic C4-dicarboxylate transporter family protein [Tessaracoccus palaemonis]|uniref:Anaerobic C4-dicarboxylate transporter family protein n=1 Tax=Tessaracoccus palaemonis TaxID=2829499 RepID=A0ABX8SF49_9ACTN|nr:anaerobic C4-dicarboxylate transporter family protein [Tessaracoccus palaemonis]QXT62001.1 anaerobic C4-dicarboxylate transporter family protein [Tessaracoccus palaemonis]
MTINLILEALVMLGAIAMGTRSGGVGVGLWGGLGTFVLVFVFREAPGSPPTDAVAIILAVVTTAALMQAAGGIDWMVAVAARVIEKRPRQITLIAPLTAFLFSVGAGTGNIIYPLLPVIYDVSYRNNIRPARPLSVTVVQSAIALAASPVSAAMAAMLTLTYVEPYNLGLGQILAITVPACVIGIVVTALVVNRMWPELDDDPDVQARIASGELAPPSSDDGESAASRLTFTSRGRASAVVFLLGVVAVVFFGIFPGLRPDVASGDGTAPVGMTTTIVLVMFTVGVLILLVGRPDVATVPDQSVFKAGMISAIALLGIAWLTATFISAHEAYIIDTIGGQVTQWPFMLALAVFLVAALTTSQSTATRTIVPIGLAAGMPAGLVTGLWVGGLGGIYTLPANGTQIAVANFDLTGTTKLGTKLVDHSFFVPMLILSVTTTAAGALIGVLLF